MSNAVSKFKYSAIAASGAVLLILGVIVTARGAITSGGVKSWATGISLVLGGVGLQNVGLKRLIAILNNEKLDRILQQRAQEIEEILEQRRLLEIPTPCRACRNFHGGRYEEVMLVCAIHPSGVEADSCPDYEESNGIRKI